MSSPYEDLWAAKRTVQKCKERGVPPPNETAPGLFDSGYSDSALRRVAREIGYVEPWASYLAPYVLRARRARRGSPH